MNGLRRTNRLPGRSHARVGFQSFQQLRDGAVLPGENQIRRDFTQGLKHEPPLVRPRVRERQCFRNNFLPSKHDEIKIQRARFVEYLLRATSELLFQQL